MSLLEDRLKLPIQPVHKFIPMPVHGLNQKSEFAENIKPNHGLKITLPKGEFVDKIMDNRDWSPTSDYLNQGVKYFPFLLIAILLFYQMFGEKATYQMVLVVFISTLVMRINELDLLLKGGK